MEEEEEKKEEFEHWEIVEEEGGRVRENLFLFFLVFGEMECE